MTSLLSGLKTIFKWTALILSNFFPQIVVRCNWEIKKVHPPINFDEYSLIGALPRSFLKKTVPCVWSLAIFMDNCPVGCRYQLPVRSLFTISTAISCEGVTLIAQHCKANYWWLSKQMRKITRIRREKIFIQEERFLRGFFLRSIFDEQMRGFYFYRKLFVWR